MAFDDELEASSVRISVRIETLPEPTIVGPADGSNFAAGAAITFTGDVVDRDGGTAVLTWRSDLEGILGTGSPVVRSDLSIGIHTVWLIAFDDESQVDSVSRSVSVSGFALDFDGSQSTETPDANDLDLTTTFTIEMWIRPSNVTGTLQHLLSKWGSGGSAAYHVAITNESGLDRKLQFATRDASGSTFVFSNTSLQNGLWQHVAAVFDNGEARIYIDGQLDTTRAGMNVPQVTSQTVSLARERSSNPKFYSGVIDEVRLWNVARTAAQIVANKDAGLTGAEVGLVAYWPLNEGSGDTAFDVTGNGHDMRLGDAVGLDAADPRWAFPGKL